MVVRRRRLGNWFLEKWRRTLSSLRRRSLKDLGRDCTEYPGTGGVRRCVWATWSKCASLRMPRVRVSVLGEGVVTFGLNSVSASKSLCDLVHVTTGNTWTHWDPFGIKHLTKPKQGYLNFSWIQPSVLSFVERRELTNVRPLGHTAAFICKLSRRDQNRKSVTRSP